LAFGHGRRSVVLVEPEYTCRSPGFAVADVQLLTPVISSRIFSVIVLLVQSTAVSQRASRPHSLQNMNRVTSLVGVANVDRECVKTRSVFVRAHNRPTAAAAATLALSRKLPRASGGTSLAVPAERDDVLCRFCGLHTGAR
jgi:hypothetical protein